MGLDLDAVLLEIARDGPRRADVYAARAAGYLGAAVGADLLLVLEELRLLEFAGHLPELAHGAGQRERVRARSDIALRGLRNIDQRAVVQVEHQVEALAAPGLGALEIDRLDVAASLDARAVRLALCKIDLVGVIDRLLGTGVDAGVTARADLEVDRIGLIPFDLER